MHERSNYWLLHGLYLLVAINLRVFIDAYLLPCRYPFLAVYISEPCHTEDMQ